MVGCVAVTIRAFTGRPGDFDLSILLPLLRSGSLALAISLAAIPAAQADAQAADVKGENVKGGVDAWSDGDYEGAIRLWQPLAAKGDADAQFNLAQAYKMGRGVPMDLTHAEELYGKAAAQGHVQAADAYGVLLFQRGERARALPYIEASAARGDARAEYILGIGHFNGDIVKKDWVRAYALVSLAQQEGLPQATNALAQMDQHIPLADRQKSVPLAQQIAGQAQANRQRLNASAELGTRAGATAPAPEIVEARSAVAQASRAAGTTGPASAGADYTRPAPAPVPARSQPAQAIPAPPRAVVAKAEPAPRPLAKPLANPVAKPPTAPATASGTWRVQLGAFGVAGNADALWSRIKARPELAGHPRALVPAGKLTKLQATGFASKAEADAACARLTAGGFGCLPTRD